MVHIGRSTTSVSDAISVIHERHMCITRLLFGPVDREPVVPQALGDESAAAPPAPCAVGDVDLRGIEMVREGNAPPLLPVARAAGGSGVAGDPRGWVDLRLAPWTRWAVPRLAVAAFGRIRA